MLDRDQRTVCDRSLRESADEQKFPCLDINPCFQSIEVDAARQLAPVELHLVVPRFLLPVYEPSDLLAEGVENGESNV